MAETTLRQHVIAARQLHDDRMERAKSSQAQRLTANALEIERMYLDTALLMLDEAFQHAESLRKTLDAVSQHLGLARKEPN